MNAIKPILVSANIAKLSARLAEQDHPYQILFCAVKSEGQRAPELVWCAIPYPVSRFAVAQVYNQVALGAWAWNNVIELSLSHPEASRTLGPDI